MKDSRAMRRLLSPRVIGLAIVALLAAREGSAYVGPGAGFAFVSSFFILLVTFFLSCMTLLTWPMRWAIKSIRGRRALRNARVKKVIILGLDGQDPGLTQEFLDRGMLPNFAKLRDQGCFTELGTTLLAESPVAWSSFQTGCNPGKHRIYDFLVPNRKNYLPELSSALVKPPSRVLRIGKYMIPIGKPLIQLGRKSQTFWKVLGDHGVFSTVLRVPITFPPEKFNGLLLSAMGAPDLRGSQGTYSYYSSDPEDKRELTSGMQVPLTLDGDIARGELMGPENSLVKGGGEMTLGFEVTRKGEGEGEPCELLLDKQRVELRVGEFTPWVRVAFRPGLGIKVWGICQFHLLESYPNVRLHVSPINIDPEKPALPVSHPFTYAIYLAKTQGAFSTLGLAEDTSALNEEVISETAFLEQTSIIHRERERMYFDAIEKTNHGCVVCVFDITDRVQHMFFRHLQDDHPANRGRDNETHRGAIEKLYRDMDDLVGRTMEKVDDDTALIVMSDHGFKPFRRGVNLNTWLWKNGYMELKRDPEERDMFADVDWKKTRAYAVGFGGIYLNMAGRERDGVVKPGEEAQELKREVAEKLGALYDEVEQVNAVAKVYTNEEAFHGPYAAEGPDLVVGFRPGHRVGWSSVTGGFSDEVIEDNTRHWSGDHNFNPPDVPGMIFCNRPISVKNPSIMDIGPTVLDLFGVPVPSFCDGRSIMPAGEAPQEPVKTGEADETSKEVETAAARTGA